jgi:zinc finger SWIM domain-containing protein 3
MNRPVHYKCETELEQYLQVLTPYAFNLVSKNAGTKVALDLPSDASPESEFSITDRQRELTVSAGSCSCAFFKDIQLPCRHIFAIRKSLGLNAFDEKLINPRWSRSFFCSTNSDSSAVESLTQIHIAKVLDCLLCQIRSLHLK